MNILKRLELKIENYYRNKLFSNMLVERRIYEDKLPKYELNIENVKNAKLLLNRAQLLDFLPKNAIVAEIGVDQGDFSEEILNITNPKKLHLVDAWGDNDRYHDGLKEIVADKFIKEIDEKTIELNVGLSTSVLEIFPDKYFDWVYLDTAHTYEVTSSELSILKLKMKPNGIIAGHDFTVCNWLGNLRYGVIEAVHEFCITENWELLYLSCEVHQHRSFAIKKI